MTATPPSKQEYKPLIDMPRIVLLALTLILPLITQCGRIGGYKSISYSKGKLSTPPTTLSQRDYPFDAKGRYRTDWVKGGSTKKRSKSSFNTAAASPPQPQAQAQPKTQTRPALAQNTKKSSPPKSKPKPSSTGVTMASNTSHSTKTPAPPTVHTPPPAPTQPKPKPPTPKPQTRYHTIAKGDTLWGIGRRYKVSIAAIKSANGLSSDLIRPGQTLRIP